MERHCEKSHEKSEQGDRNKVAFFAGLSESIGPFGKNTDIVFDSLVTNVGSAYSYSTGQFTAPVKATYQFNVTVGAQHFKRATVKLVKNGVMMMTVWSVALPEWVPASNVAILSLDAGDKVWLQLEGGESCVYGKMTTTFSGFLIFESKCKE